MLLHYFFYLNDHLSPPVNLAEALDESHMTTFWLPTLVTHHGLRATEGI
jgi:hypothetical protein